MNIGYHVFPAHRGPVSGAAVTSGAVVTSEAPEGDRPASPSPPLQPAATNATTRTTANERRIIGFSLRPRPVDHASWVFCTIGATAPRTQVTSTVGRVGTTSTRGLGSMARLSSVGDCSENDSENDSYNGSGGVWRYDKDHGPPCCPDGTAGWANPHRRRSSIRSSPCPGRWRADPERSAARTRRASRSGSCAP